MVCVLFLPTSIRMIKIKGEDYRHNIHGRQQSRPSYCSLVVRPDAYANNNPIFHPVSNCGVKPNYN